MRTPTDNRKSKLSGANWWQFVTVLRATSGRQTKPNQNPSQSKAAQLRTNSDAVRPRSRHRSSLRALSKLRPQSWQCVESSLSFALQVETTSQPLQDASQT